MNEIKRVTIVGGTHGNEYSGIYLLKKWTKTPSLVERPSFKTCTLFANETAFIENKRYIDMDLNRQFLVSDLRNKTLINHEQTKAKEINQQLGPKGNAKTDLIIDLHNTTSNMGPTLILLKTDAFNTQLAAYISLKMKNAVILFEDKQGVLEQPFLCSISNQGIIIEVGSQPHSVLRQDIFESMEEITQHVLDFVQLFNTNKIPSLPSSISAFRYVETLTLPLNTAGERIGMVHKNRQDSDFQPIKNGDVLFTLFDGTELFWEGDYEAFPHFVNEAAYYDNNLEMSLAEKIKMDVIYGDQSNYKLRG